MIAINLLAALLQVSGAASSRIDIVTSATNVIVTGSPSESAVRVATSTGVQRPSVTTSGAVTTIRDADESERIIRGTYEVVVPGGSSVSLRVRCIVENDLPCPNATVRITAVAAVEYEGVDGNATIGSVRGDVNAASLYGTLTITDVGGKVEAASQTNAVNVRNVRGEVQVRSTTGMIALESLVGGATATNTTGEIKLSGTVGSQSRYQMTTDIGQIRIYLADGSNATIEVNANPDAINVRTKGARITSRGERRRTVIVGTGSTRISARTLQGGVDIGRRQ